MLLAPLVGSSVPRIGTPPFGDDTRVQEIISFSSDLGVTLLPWQETLFDRSLRLNEEGRYQHRLALAVTARQSGKTRASGIRALAELFLWGAELVVMAAQSRDVCLESFRHTVELAEAAGLPILKERRATGSEELILDVDGRHARLKVVSSTSGGARGLSPDLVIWDELQAMKTHEPYSALEKSRRARRGSQLLAITSEGTHESVVLQELQTQGRAAAEQGRSDGIAYLEWSAHPDRAADDREGWRESNPALGHLIDEATIADELRTDPPEVFEREVLGRATAVARSWLPSGLWEAATDPTATVPDSAVGEVVFALDASPDLQHASVAVGWPRPDGRTHLELIATFASTLAAEARLHDLVSRWQPRTLVVVAKGPAEPVAGRVAAASDVEVMTASGADLDRASRVFYEAVASSRLTHPPDVVLSSHLDACAASSPGLLALKGATVNITGAVAAVLACWAVDRVPVATVPTWVAF